MASTNKFISAIDNSVNLTTTWNDALSHGKVDPTDNNDGLISIFFKAVRGLDHSRFSEYLSTASKEDLVKTFLLVFHLRDSRGGKGERSLGRFGHKWLIENFPEKSLQVSKFVAEYGRFDDIVFLAKSSSEFYSIIHKQLEQDLVDMNNGKPISLLAKWMPRQGSKTDNQTHFVAEYCRRYSLSFRQYRKDIVVPLTSYLNVVECFMCNKKWNEIDYNRVPSVAMHKLKKAFDRNDKNRFNEWKMGLETGKTKVNASQLNPDDLIKPLLSFSSKVDQVIEQQWKELIKIAPRIANFIPVCDVSGSMSGKPMEVSIGLGLYLANTIQEPFNGRIMTFSSKPQWHTVDTTKTLFSQVKSLSQVHWEMSTNIQACFDLILRQALRHNLKSEDIPGLIIISDMQFDRACSNCHTNLEIAEQKFRDQGLERPPLVFWNVQGATVDFPATTNDKNVALVSGFSPSILSAFINCGELSPISLMNVVLNSKRYSPIKEALQENTSSEKKLNDNWS